MDDFTIAIPKGRLTVEQALDRDSDVIPVLANLEHTLDFQRQLDLRRSQIEKLIQRHLGIPQSGFVLSQPSEWIWGSFNICLPIDIISAYDKKLPRQVLIRFPLPFNVGEDFRPGSIDEKLRCEAATYIWLRSNCPTVPIPRLLACSQFTAIENESLWNRMIWHLRRSLAWLHGETLAPYFTHRRESLTDTGYLLMEYVEEGRMLSSSWQRHRHDERRQTNLYRGLAKIMLGLARVPLPRIGSWTMSDRGVLSLTNRPLFDLALFWNKNRIPTGIPRDLTYTSTEPFIQDLLNLQDNRMHFQPNSILSKNDGIYQLSALVGLRALLPQFWNQASRDGPFVPTLTDMHQSNIFVDDEWNVTRLIDFEFAPIRPVQMVRVPSWLSGRGVDELDGLHLEEYKGLYDKFVSIVEEEENAGQLGNTYSQGLREDWATGRTWYTMALGSINAFPAIFEQHLRPKFFDDFQLSTDGVALTRLWDGDVWAFIDRKVKENDRYVDQVREIFAAAQARENEDSAERVEDEAGDGFPKEEERMQNGENATAKS
nr:hypothetical protein CFP56_09907 [Quercus suber]